MEPIDWSKPIELMNAEPREHWVHSEAVWVGVKGNHVGFYTDRQGCIGGVQVVRNRDVQAIEQERDALKSKQTRWVKCSERLPTIPKDYPCVIEGMVSGVLGREYIFGSLSDDGKLLPNEHIAPQWKIVAWLEGMPEYVP